MSFPVLPFPDKRVISGRAVTLEPLNAAHVEDLARLATAAPDSFAFLRYGPFEDVASLRGCVDDLSSRANQPFWAVIDHRVHRACGWLSLCDISPPDGAIEIGSIWFSPPLQRSRAATEAIVLLMGEAFDRLGYERLVWRHVVANTPSRASALRYGFTYEGTWRKATTFKSVRHDVAWYSILSEEWSARRAAYESWLACDNFDTDGRQKRSMKEIIEAARADARSSSSP